MAIGAGESRVLVQMTGHFEMAIALDLAQRTIRKSIGGKSSADHSAALRVTRELAVLGWQRQFTGGGQGNLIITIS